jgi:predicted transcriptional regulator
MSAEVLDERLWSVARTAKYLGRSEEWVRRYFTKKVKPIRDGELRFDIKDVDQYIENLKR